LRAAGSAEGAGGGDAEGGGTDEGGDGDESTKSHPQRTTSDPQCCSALSAAARAVVLELHPEGERLESFLLRLRSAWWPAVSAAGGGGHAADAHLEHPHTRDTHAPQPRPLGEGGGGGGGGTRGDVKEVVVLVGDNRGLGDTGDSIYLMY
jgi:hypothetical protein